VRVQVGHSMLRASERPIGLETVREDKSKVWREGGESSGVSRNSELAGALPVRADATSID
jgi:hypothetical protein